jgi:hypothetical protein
VVVEYPVLPLTTHLQVAHLKEHRKGKWYHRGKITKEKLPKDFSYKSNQEQCRRVSNQKILKISTKLIAIVMANPSSTNGHRAKSNNYYSDNLLNLHIYPILHSLLVKVWQTSLSLAYGWLITYDMQQHQIRPLCRVDLLGTSVTVPSLKVIMDISLGVNCQWFLASQRSESGRSGAGDSGGREMNRYDFLFEPVARLGQTTNFPNANVVEKHVQFFLWICCCRRQWDLRVVKMKIIININQLCER